MKKRIKFAWLILTSRRFRLWLLFALRYAHKHAMSCSGEGASDVVMFVAKYGDIFETVDFDWRYDSGAVSSSGTSNDETEV